MLTLVLREIPPLVGRVGLLLPPSVPINLVSKDFYCLSPPPQEALISLKFGSVVIRDGNKLDQKKTRSFQRVELHRKSSLS